MQHFWIEIPPFRAAAQNSGIFSRSGIVEFRAAAQNSGISIQNSCITSALLRARSAQVNAHMRLHEAKEVGTDMSYGDLFRFNSKILILKIIDFQNGYKKHY